MKALAKEMLANMTGGGTGANQYAAASREAAAKSQSEAAAEEGISRATKVGSSRELLKSQAEAAAEGRHQPCDYPARQTT